MAILDLQVAYTAAAATPESLGSIGYFGAFDGETINFTEGFGRIENAVYQF